MVPCPEIRNQTVLMKDRQKTQMMSAVEAPRAAYKEGGMVEQVERGEIENTK